VEVGGTAPLSYQWSRNGVPIAGATGRFHELAAAAAGDAGDYMVEVSNSFGAATTAAATVALDPDASARLVNMSVRAPLAAGATLIPGFVTTGTGSRQMLADHGVVGFHADPAMTFHAGPSSTFTNDNWGAADNAAEIASVTEQLGGFPLEADSADAAALLDVVPGLYTTHVTGVGGATGVMLFELYVGEGGDSRLVNVSARGDIGTGENIMIPGFVVSGNGAKTLLIRAVGPSLDNHGVSGWLADPALTIHESGAPILAIDNWGQAPDVGELVAVSEAVGAFPLIEGSTDAAVLVVLMPGIYTAIASGVGGTTGNVLVEVYEVQ
jgi:hypothetical protein